VHVLLLKEFIAGAFSVRHFKFYCYRFLTLISIGLCSKNLWLLLDVYNEVYKQIAEYFW